MRTTWEKFGRRELERGLGTVDGEQSESMYWLQRGFDMGRNDGDDEES
jgi:hypothetical protein